MTNGAGYFTDPHPHVTQVDGGFGHNHDGYWHYRFHNWSGQTVRVQFWGVCSEYDQTGGVNGG
jgi:hypothetical protein